ncbi:MAG: DNA repair protein RecO [Acholeplasmataceae bacterium]
MEGIIYKVQPYQESSKLLYVMTPEGKRTLHAKGAQKITSPYRTLTQYLTHISFENSPKMMFTLKDVTCINDFKDIKASIPDLKAAAFVLEMFDRLILDQEPHGALYQSLIKFLNHKSYEHNALRIAFHFLYDLGYDISLEPDGRRIKGFNIAQGRLIYEDETMTSDVKMDDLIMLLHIKKTTYDTIIEIPKDAYSRLKSFMKSFIEYHLHTTIKN